MLNVQYYLCLIILIHLSPHSSANVMYNVLAVSVGLLIDHQYSIIFFSLSPLLLFCTVKLNNNNNNKNNNTVIVLNFADFPKNASFKGYGVICLPRAAPAS